MTSLEVLLGISLVLVVVGILYLWLGCEKPGPGGKR